MGILGSLIFIALLFYRLKHGRKAIRLGRDGTGCCSAMPDLKGGAGFMNTAAMRANQRKLLILAAIVLFCAAGYLLVEVNFSNPSCLPTP